ncbi:hypothetical protein TNCV_3541271 [Trichonephila clavipes]|nr:hypothetical protein TNCV_3541271 [Trichonephila clavipes]
MFRSTVHVELDTKENLQRVHYHTYIFKEIIMDFFLVSENTCYSRPTSRTSTLREHGNWNEKRGWSICQISTDNLQCIDCSKDSWNKGIRDVNARSAAGVYMSQENDEIRNFIKSPRERIT